MPTPQTTQPDAPGTPNVARQYFAPALNPARLPRPRFASPIRAGFPSPADDYIAERLDLNEHLINHAEATYFLRVVGSSMVEAGINEGDLLVVDRSLTPRHRSIVVAVVDGDFTVKRLYRRLDDWSLRLSGDLADA